MIKITRNGLILTHDSAGRQVSSNATIEDAIEAIINDADSGSTTASYTITYPTRSVRVIRRALALPPRPASVVDVTVIGFSSSSVTLDWSDSPSTGVVGYRIYYSTDNVTFSRFGTQFTLSTGAVTGLTSATTYYFKVAAVSSAGEESALLAASVSQLTGPDPAGVAAVVALYDAVGNVTGYGPSANHLGLFYGVTGMENGDTWWVRTQPTGATVTARVGGDFDATTANVVVQSYTFAWARWDLSAGVAILGSKTIAF